MDKNRQKIVIIASMVVVALTLIYRSRSTHVHGPAVLTSNKAGPCPGPVEEIVMPDPYMRGFIEEGAKFKVVTNFYSCNPIKNDDIIVLSRGASLPPLVRFVRGVSGDTFELVKDSEHQAWNVKVNDKIVLAQGKPHFFGGTNAPTLAMYEKSRGGVLGPGEILLFSSWSPGDYDSSIYGIFNVSDVIGKVEIKH